MREIKFRAWNEDEKLMFPGLTIDLIKEMAEGDIGPAGIILFHGWKHLIWMQYTGLKDKNGKEIYEGDIVKYLGYEVKNSKQIRTERFFEVDWDYHTLFSIDSLIKNNGTLEVVGNKFEDPKLLKQIIQ